MQAPPTNDALAALSQLPSDLMTWHNGAAVAGLAVLCLLLLPLTLGLRLRRRRATAHSRPSELDRLRAARRDPLTGLPNRQSFGEALARRLHAGGRAALILIDIDKFRDINNTHGHRLGDAALVAVADRLRPLLPEGDQLARLDGDEFGVLLDAPSGLASIESAALQILRVMGAPLMVGPSTITCGISMGVALAPDHGDDADRLMRAADLALASAKASGGDAWRVFVPERDAAARLRERMKEELRLALPARQIVPYYQPIVDLRSGEMIGLEVLARWQHPENGLLLPETFIPLAEEMLICGELTQHLMRRVIADARDWPPWLYFAFNVSPGQLRELIGMIRTPPDWPEGTLDPRRIEVEVTESAVIEEIDVAREVIALLQGRGTRVVLDDFGIGYSNFFHLRELPFDRIKIDKSFVLDMGHDPRANACVRAMLALGQSLGIEMEAEGIETLEAAATLAQLGCRFGQGYLYSPPVPGSGIQAVLRQLAQQGALSAAP